MAQVPREGPAVEVRAKIRLFHDVTRVRWLNHLEVSLHLDAQIQRAMIFIGASPIQRHKQSQAQDAKRFEQLRNAVPKAANSPAESSAMAKPSQHHGNVNSWGQRHLHPHYWAKPWCLCRLRLCLATDSCTTSRLPRMQKPDRKQLQS